MAQYTVKSGQNIYDVSMTLYGSVEGVFDLLVCNQWLNVETTLTAGTVLEYNDNLVVNRDVISWMSRTGTTFRIGEHPIDVRSGLEVFQNHLSKFHKARWKQILEESQDVQEKYWAWLAVPKMVVSHQEIQTVIRVSFLRGTHMVVDWGDNSPMEVLEGADVIEADHAYKSNTRHKIGLYGDFRCGLLDISAIHGPYYPTSVLIINDFRPSDPDPKHKALIITEEESQ